VREREGGIYRGRREGKRERVSYIEGEKGRE
jgi:hypothetical protein